MRIFKSIIAQLIYILPYCLSCNNPRSLQTPNIQGPINLSNDFSNYTYLNSLYINSTSYLNLTNPIIFVFNDGDKFATHDLTLGSISLYCNGTQYEYKATELLFVLPSENTIENQHAQIEMQIHHKLQLTSNDPLIKNTLIISIFFLQLENQTNEFIRSFINFRDDSNDDDLIHTIDEKLPTYNITNQSISNLNKIVKKNKMFYYYYETTTATPIEDNIAWMIMNYFYYLSDAQYQQFEKLIKKYHPNGNNRKVNENDPLVYLLYNDTITINMVLAHSLFLKYSVIDLVLFILMWMIICLI